MKLKRILVLAVFILLSASIYASTVNILYFNDFHGQVEASKKYPGMVKFVSFIDQFKKENPNTIVLSGGDNYQGLIVSNLTRGAVVNKMFKMIGLVASAVGNHEFDWGLEYFPKWQENGAFTYLAANVVNKKDGKVPSWIKPYKIVTVDDKKIAIIGLATTDTVNTTLIDNIKNLDFENPETTLKKYIGIIKKTEKPDAFIVISHVPADMNKENKKIEGQEISGLLKSKDDVAVFFCGHNHAVIQGNVNTEPVFEAGAKGDYLINVKLEFDDNNKLVSIKDFLLDVMNSNPETINKEAQKTLDFYNEKLEKMSQKVIGKSSGDMPKETEKYHLSVAGATMCKIIAEMSNCQVAILNQWGIRSDLKKGEITFGDLYRVLPFDNTVVTMKISGKKLKEQIEHSITLQGGDYYGVKVVYDSGKPEGQRLESLELADGTPVENDKYYTLAINNFMYTGGDKYNFEGAKDVVDTQMTLRGLVLKYIEKQKTISPVNTDYSVIK